jgi:Ca2+-binding RTX toxin-like protein
VFSKELKFGSQLVGLLSAIGITLLLQNLAWAANISCDSAGLCEGTNGDDIIKDGDDGQIIDGLPGNDIINSGGGDDDVCGGPGNDRIHLGNGNDRAWGDGSICKGMPGPEGSDRINGGPGDDIITHGFVWDTESDGFKDFLDCGPGDDIALLNITVDRDEAASNCEHINPYP